MAPEADVFFPPQEPQPFVAPPRSGWLETLYKILPIVEWLPAYSWQEHGVKDLSGGITLGCILVAQSLAHADLCKVQLIHGPYSCIMPPILYSIFGTCVHSSVGTGGLISLLTGEQLAQYGNLEERTHAGAIFTLLVGIVITLMGIFRLAFLVRFLSRPALSGFITASAILIMASQIKPMLGLPKSDTGGIFAIALSHPRDFQVVRLATVAMSLCALTYLSVIKKLKSLHWTLRLLGDFKELTLLAFSAIFATRFAADFGISVVGDVPAGLPSSSWPLQTADDLALAQEMLPGATMVALVTFLSSFAGAKKFAMQAGYQVIAINELLALGFANLGGALYGAVPTQIGLSRMGIAYSTGVMSQLGANVWVAVVVALVLKLFSSYLYFVPRCVLNVIILLGAQHLTEFQHMSWLVSLRSTRTRQRTYLVDFSVWWTAFLFTLFFGAFRGILGAVFVSLLLVLYQVADPPIARLGFSSARGRWLNMKAHGDAQPRAGIVAFRLEGPLFYANVERLEEWLAEVEVAASLEGQPVKAMILSAAAMPFVDTTALESLKQLVKAYRKRNITFLVSNACGQPQKILQLALGDSLPEESLTAPWTTEECVRWLAGQAQLAKEAASAPESPPLQKGDLPRPPKQHKPGSFRANSSNASLKQRLSLLLGKESSEDLKIQLLPAGDADAEEPVDEEMPATTEVLPLRRSVVWASMPHDLNELAETQLQHGPKRLVAPPSCPDRLNLLKPGG